MDKFTGVNVIKAANVYFDGKVTSRALEFAESYGHVMDFTVLRALKSLLAPSTKWAADSFPDEIENAGAGPRTIASAAITSIEKDEKVIVEEVPGVADIKAKRVKYKGNVFPLWPDSPDVQGHQLVGPAPPL